jgi:mRNA-degrading endonuclease YafQ of YafQ-DinJ toxin-antitoxin module
MACNRDGYGIQTQPEATLWYDVMHGMHDDAYHNSRYREHPVERIWRGRREKHSIYQTFIRVYIIVKLYCAGEALTLDQNTNQLGPSINTVLTLTNAPDCSLRARWRPGCQ